MNQQALHVYSVAEEEWVIAADGDDAMAVMRETGADPGEPDHYEQCADAKPFTFNDGDVSATKTFGEWAAERGRGYFCTANY